MEQLSEPEAEYSPVLQFVHTVEPTSEYVPASQIVSTSPEQLYPGGHFVEQLSEPEAEYSPVLQFVQRPVLLPPYCPALCYLSSMVGRARVGRRGKRKKPSKGKRVLPCRRQPLLVKTCLSVSFPTPYLYYLNNAILQSYGTNGWRYLPHERSKTRNTQTEGARA